MFKPVIIGRFRIRKESTVFRIDENCSSYNKKLRGEGLYFTHAKSYGTLKNSLLHIARIIAKDLEGTCDYRTIEKMLLKNYNFSI